MALLRNIAGVSKLGIAPEEDMQRLEPDTNGGGGGYYYEPVIPEDVQPTDPMPKDYGGGGGGPMPADFFQPEDTGGTDDNSQQPVYPVLPIREYEELPPQPVVPVNTVNLGPAASGGVQNADLTALGVLAGVFFMMMGARPKGALGTVAYVGGLGLLYLRLKHVQTAAQPANVQ